MPQNFCAEMLAGSFARRRILRLYMRASAGRGCDAQEPFSLHIEFNRLSGADIGQARHITCKVNGQRNAADVMRELRYLSRPGKACFTADRHDIRGLRIRHHHAVYRAGVMGMAVGDAHRGRWMDGAHIEITRRAVKPLGSIYEDLRWVQNVTVT